MSPFSAWILLKSLETMHMRVDHMTKSAAVVAQFLESRPEVSVIRYPGLKQHPGHEVAMRQMNNQGGSMIGFEVKGGRDAAFKLMNNLKVIDISNNLGDSKSLITHPDSSTHRKLAPEVKAAVGITPGVLRLSVGLEAASDLVKDLEQAFKALK